MKHDGNFPHPFNDPAPRPSATPAQLFGVTLGNALEFYDFLIFSFFAVQIGQTFFPANNPQSSLLAALATFGAGFLMRPLGALMIGGLGDRLGRRPMLFLSFSLIGLASLGGAITPSYASIGMAAPLILLVCRLVQGFALGGEVGASSAFLAEAAPPARRGFYIGLQFLGQGIAVLLSGTVGVLLSSMLDDKALAIWGWRAAMGLGIAIVPIGLVLRSSLPETQPATISSAPRPSFTRYRGVALLALLTMLSGTITTYVLNYTSIYAKTVLHLPSSISFGGTVAIGIGFVLGSLIGGLGSDRWGRRPLMIWPLLIGSLAIMPGFWLLSAYPGRASLYAVGFLLRLILSTSMTAAFVSTTEAFPARVRSGGVAVMYAIATSVFGGSTQFIVAWLTGVTGNPLAPAWYMLAAALFGLIATLFARETAPAKTGRTISSL